jgi:hypothetical protein
MLFTKRILTAVGVAFISGAIWACHSQEEAVKQAEDEVLDIHDEIMPKMDDIMKVKKQLTLRITSLDSLKATGSATATLRTDEEKEQATRLRRDLVVADSLMSDWMTHYNGDTLGKLSSEDALRYLADQKDQITDVKKKFTNSIEQARQFLEKH